MFGIEFVGLLESIGGFMQAKEDGAMKLSEYTKGWTWRPRQAAVHDNYPLDLDGSERYTRPPTGVDKWPYPPIIGHVSGLFPQQDMLIWAGQFGKTPSGPGSTTVPINLQWQAVIPGLTKVS